VPAAAAAAPMPMGAAPSARIAPAPSDLRAPLAPPSIVAEPSAPAAQTAARPSTPLPPSVLPAEAEMSEADRRLVQAALQRLDYYKGPLDGIFGPLTRTAIRRFQRQDIGSEPTGHLTADQANRLAGPR
jgi:peptidoglycan hydrolase-like protein with peptidoglycan-binding domain